MTNSNATISPLSVCAAVILKKGKILLTRRPLDKKMGGFWEFPGGKIEPGETPQDALQRELQEELDIEIEVGPLLANVLHNYEWGAVAIHAFWCHWSGGQISHLEVIDHSWVTPAELPDYDILPADAPLISKLQAMDINDSFSFR